MRFVVDADCLIAGTLAESGAASDLLRLWRSGEFELVEREVPTPGFGEALVRVHACGVCHSDMLAKEGGYATLRMPSGEIRRVSAECRATVGEVGNAEQGNIKLGKAGRNRWKGKRPSVRGVAMNPIDHPHGGGEGKSSGGRHPVSPWGKPEGRTRRDHKPSDRLISRRRSRGKNKR